MQANLLSTSRLPLDHFISGSLIAGIGVGALNLDDFKSKKISGKAYALKIAKSALNGGIATSLAIYASNNIAKGEFLKASMVVVGGVLTLNLISNLKEK